MSSVRNNTFSSASPLPVPTPAQPVILQRSLFKTVFQSYQFAFINQDQNAIIHPSKTEKQLVASLLSSYRLILKLPFIANILENVIAKWFGQKKHLGRFQSGFHRPHQNSSS